MPRKHVSCENETRLMKNGMNATCIAYRVANDIDIQFEDGTIIEHVQKHNFYDGNVMNPNVDYHPLRRLQSLSITNPDLLAEWDYEKNDVSPENVTRSYKEKVWWKCDKGHSWPAVIQSRTRKNATGCPYCKGNIVIPGETDFETKYSELMLDWDWEKNVNINPKMITAHSGTYVNWKCHFCGYEWSTRVNNRSSAKRGCPNCSMKSTSFGEQAVFFYVKKIFPDAINRFRDGKFELDIFIPEIKTAIEFDGAFFHKGEENALREERKNLKCEELGIRLIRIKDSDAMDSKGHVEIIGIEDLQKSDNLNKAIRMLLQDIDPASNMWTRKKNHQLWSSIDAEIDVERDRFDILSDKYVRSLKNSFTNLKPGLLDDWDYELNKNINPQSITPSCSFDINWKCKVCGYRWKARVPDRIRGDGCPCCNRNVLVKGVNDFATLYPDELAEWDYENNTIQPDTIIAYHVKVAWKCKKCGHRWNASINDKVIRKDRTGCPECSKRAIAEKRHQRALKNGALFEKYPTLKDSWNYAKNIGIDMTDISPGTNKKYWWLCPICSYEWQASPNNRVKGGTIRRCPKCRTKL